MKAKQDSAIPIIAILGDSRTFDTYYVNERYTAPYGYDRTFPALWRAVQLRSPVPGYDVIHIPDHFRGGTVENNIIRLALCRPRAVILCDGIWESLLNKSLFAEYVDRQAAQFEPTKNAKVEVTYSSRTLADLFMANQLSVSPRGYAERIARIAGYFLRRGCAVYWMNLCIPGSRHLDRLHYAGNYLCAPEWGECLAALNRTVADTLSELGGVVFDTDALMQVHGGPGRALIDQWHYSASFHAALAAALADAVGPTLSSRAGNLTERMMHRADLRELRLVVLGATTAVNPPAGTVVATYADPVAVPALLPEIDCIILHTDDPAREQQAAVLRRRWPGNPVILFADELDGMPNPMPGGRDDGRRQS